MIRVSYIIHTISYHSFCTYIKTSRDSLLGCCHGLDASRCALQMSVSYPVGGVPCLVSFCFFHHVIEHVGSVHVGGAVAE